MSSPDSDNPDSTTLATLGTSIMASFVQTVTFTLMYGIFVLLFVQFAVTYMKRHKPSRAEFRMLFTSSITFLLATIHEGSLLATSGIFIHSSLIEDRNLPLIQRDPVVHQLLRIPNIIFSWMASLEVLVSDGVVVWRAYVLLQHRHWLVIIPAALLLSSFGFVLAYLIVLIIGIDHKRAWIGRFLGISLTLSLATNLTSTAIIGYVYWLHRLDRQIIGERHRPTWAERVLAKLVESGVIFCILQAANIGIQTSIPHGLVGTTFASIYYGFSAMYPTMVIVLVNNKQRQNNLYSSELPSSRFRESEYIDTLRFASVCSTGGAVGLPERTEGTIPSVKDTSSLNLTAKAPC